MVARARGATSSKPHGSARRRQGLQESQNLDQAAGGKSASATPSARTAETTAASAKLPPQSFALPNTPEGVRQQISWDADTIYRSTVHHDRWAQRWDTAGSWLRLIVSLTAGISALAILADSIVAATVFAVITAAVSAVNAGFAPSDRATQHRDAAREYGHLVRPLYELLWTLDQQGEWVQRIKRTPAGASFDEGHYTRVAISKEKLSEVWARFVALREQIEKTEDNAPGLTSLTESWERWSSTWAGADSQGNGSDTGSASEGDGQS